MKISLVRGAFMSPYDLQTYKPLAKHHELTIIGGDFQSLYPGPIELPGISVRRPPVSFSSLSRFGAGAVMQSNRLMSWTVGQSFVLSHLDEAIGQPDIIESAETFFTMTYQALQAKRKRVGAFVVTVRENLPHMGEAHPLRRRRKQAVLREADHFIAITSTTKSMLRQEGVAEEKISVVPLSIDMNRFAPAPEDPELLRLLNLKPDDFVILFIGRLIPEKGVLDLIETMDEFFAQDKTSSFKFVFLGDGPLLPELRAAAARHGSHIIIERAVDYAQIHRYHNVADIFVLPSRPGPKIAEQFGFVLVESMACAKPVITTSVGSIPDVVGNSAIVLAPGDSKSMTQTIRRLAGSEQERRSLGQKALARARDCYNAETNARRLESIYTQAIERAKRRHP